MFKIGLIGAGMMGGVHASCYHKLEALGVKVTAVADITEGRAGKLAELSGAETYGSGFDLIEKADVDAIDICLPTYLHTRHALAAMDKGRAVFIEKPVCLTRAEGLALLEKQRQTGVQVMVGQCLRFWNEYVWMKQAADDGRYGQIQSGVFQRLSALPSWSWENWLNLAQDMHIHDTDFIRYLMGEPTGIHTAATRDESQTINHIFTTYHYPSAVLFAEGVWDYPAGFPFGMGYRVKFARATAVFDSNTSPSLVVYQDDGQKVVPELNKLILDNQTSAGNLSDQGGHFNELNYFVTRLIAGESIEEAALAEGVRSLDLVLDEIESVGGARLNP